MMAPTAPNAGPGRPRRPWSRGVVLALGALAAVALAGTAACRDLLGTDEGTFAVPVPDAEGADGPDARAAATDGSSRPPPPKPPAPAVVDAAVACGAAVCSPLAPCCLSAGGPRCATDGCPGGFPVECDDDDDCRVLGPDAGCCGFYGAASARLTAVVCVRDRAACAYHLCPDGGCADGGSCAAPAPGAPLVCAP